MSSNEEYLDNLLKSIISNDDIAPADGEMSDGVKAVDEPIASEEKPMALEEMPSEEEPMALEDVPSEEEPMALEDVPSEEEPMALEDVPSEEEPMALEDVPSEEEPMALEDVPSEETTIDEDKPILIEDAEKSDEFQSQGSSEGKEETIVVDNPEVIEESEVEEEPVIEEPAEVIEEPDGSDLNKAMSTDDIEAMLASMNEGKKENDTLEETEKAEEEPGEDDDLSALLAGMSDDENLNEINKLLEKSDTGASLDDDMLALLGNTTGLEESEVDGENGDQDAFNFFMGEEEPEKESQEEDSQLSDGAGNGDAEPEEDKKSKKERKKKERKAKKDEKKKGKEDPQQQAEDILLEGLEPDDGEGQKPEKEGFFTRLLNFLTEEDEDEVQENAAQGLGEDGLPIGNPTEENMALLEEMSAEDKKGKKEKKEKKKKEKKKKGKKEEAVSSEGEEEEGGKADKKKKSKKKKKEKTEKSQEELENKEPEKKLSRKKVIPVFVFAITLTVCLILLCQILPENIQKNEARIAYDQKNYEEVYDSLYGKKLKEEDEAIFEKSNMILQMQQKLDSYQVYEQLGMPLEALDALVSGVDRYQSLLAKAEQYHVTAELKEVYDQILELLSTRFGVSETEAIAINASEDDESYTRQLNDIINGNGSNDEEAPDEMQDVLPEEEEILNRIQGEAAGQE